MDSMETYLRKLHTCHRCRILYPRATKAVLLHSLGTEGQRIFYTLPAADVPTTQTIEGASSTGTTNVYVQALATLEKRYAESFNVIVERRKFRQRAQLPDETVEDYVTALRGLAITCNYGTMLDETLRDQFVDKAVLPQVRERLLLEGSAFTLDRAVLLAGHVEQSRRAAQQQLHEESATVGRLSYNRRKNSNKPRDKLKTKKSAVCYRCGSTRHLANSPNCIARDKECFKCKKVGHFGAMCKGSSKQHHGTTREVVTDTSEDEASSPNTASAMLLEVHATKEKAIYVSVEAAGKNVKFLIDTRSSVSILSWDVYQSTFSKEFSLRPASIQLHDYSRKQIPVRGCVVIPVKYKTQCASLLFYVVQQGTTLLELDAVAALDLHIDGAQMRCLETTVTTSDCEHIAKCEFPQLFAPGLGVAKGYAHKVKLRPEVEPTVAKLRRLPLEVRSDVSKELKKLLDMDIIEPIDASPWVSPIVVAKKKDGRIRLCVDLRGPNRAVIPDCYPLPHIEELVNRLAGAKVFSKLDLTAAYHQLPLAEESRDITAFITHDGLFRYKRVCFGLASAPSAFQKLLANVLKDCSGVLHYLDDIIVHGKSEEEHARNLRQVLRCLSDAGLRLNEKCMFGVRELTFVGHTVAEGKVMPLEENVKAILEAPAPTDFRTLKSFLGMTGHYAKFIKNYADEVEPLRHLLRGEKDFQWSTNAQLCFERLKRLMSTCSALNMFDPTLPVTVTTDASGYGLGAVLRQWDGNCFRTVSFASRTLAAQERKYSAGEREALACVWAIEHWHVYLWGRRFNLETDHQALRTLLGTQGAGHRPLRISRWLTRLLNYNFAVVYKKGTENQVADALSRLPIPSTEEGIPEDDTVCLITERISKDELHRATAADPVLQDVMRYLSTEWLTKRTLPDKLAPFFNLRAELSQVDELLLRGERIVVPSTLIPKVIALAHEAHGGMVRTKQRLRQLYWWPPAIDSSVEAAILECAVCQTADKSAKTVSAPLTPVPLPNAPWEKLGMDIMGPYEEAPHDCRYMITLIDYYSRWPEVCFSSAVTSTTVIKFLRQVFSREGYPSQIITDNGPQFVSQEFESFLQGCGIRHTCSSVYHPQGNGMIERFNQVLKNFIQISRLEQRSIKEAVLEYLLVYRATPHGSTGLAPAYLLHRRNIRTKLDIVGFPTTRFFEDPAHEMEQLRRKVEEKQKDTKTYVDSKRGAQPRDFKPGDFVRVKLPRHQRKGRPRFSEPKKIIEKRGPNSFLLDDKKIWNASRFSKVHKDVAPKLLQSRSPETESTPVALYWEPESSTREDLVVQAGAQVRQPNLPEPPRQNNEDCAPQLRRSTRRRALPTRLKDYSC
ncbi:uncharacterized protein K02A2.6-like [Ornithodoros turicata]|uniref:uncharacterized protein K02A2.6-like n=1 Tax=Ornithodoros turicata TaxID=34597 RepID=UPI0031391404